MKSHFDKVGMVGALVGAFATAPACCLPLLATVGASVGLSVFAQFNSTLVYLLQFFSVVSVIGAYLGFRAHKNWMPFALSIASTLAIIYVYNVELSQGALLSGLLGLIISAIWNTIESKKNGRCAARDVQLRSTITCPFCGHKQTETMPIDFCLFFYTCKACRVLLKPKEGDCCVFCSYGNEKCPQIQMGMCAS